MSSILEWCMRLIIYFMFIFIFRNHCHDKARSSRRGWKQTKETFHASAAQYCCVIPMLLTSFSTKFEVLKLEVWKNLPGNSLYISRFNFHVAHSKLIAFPDFALLLRTFLCKKIFDLQEHRIQVAAIHIPTCWINWKNTSYWNKI